MKKKKKVLKGRLEMVIYLIFSVVLYPCLDDSVSAQDDVVIGRWVVEYGWVVYPLDTFTNFRYFPSIYISI
jgi:hypothetical protein